MRKNHFIKVALAAAVIGLPGLSAADEHYGCYGYCSHSACVQPEPAYRGGLIVERPAWVMVFSLDFDGRLTLLTRGRTGVYVSQRSGQSDVLCGSSGPQAGSRYDIVVYSDAPFALPRGFARAHKFRVDKRGWHEEHSRRLCRSLGVRPETVRVVVHAQRGWSRPACNHGAFVGAGLWAAITAGGRVYVDGGFRGRGVEAMFSVPPGRKRVSVVTDSGHKYSEWVAFPVSRCEHFTLEPFRACP